MSEQKEENEENDTLDNVFISEQELLSALTFLEDYKQKATNIIAERIDAVEEIAKQLYNFKLKREENEDDTTFLLRLYTQTINEFNHYQELVMTSFANSNDHWFLSLWRNICVNLKNIIEHEYWTSNNANYLHISESAYKVAITFSYWNKAFAASTPLDLSNNHNDRSVRLTYALNKFFNNAEVLMAKPKHGVDAVICYKNERSEITDQNGRVIPVTNLNRYINKSIKTHTGLLSFNTEYKTFTVDLLEPESILNSLIWFSHIKAKKDTGLIDCLVYSIASTLNDLNSFDFFILDKSTLILFNKLLDYERKLYWCLHDLGNYFTKEELLWDDADEKNPDKTFKGVRFVSDFDATDLQIWMLYQCKVFYKTSIDVDNITWNQQETTLKDALIKRFGYDKLEDLVITLDQTVLESFKDYINKYTRKIKQAHTYLLGLSVSLFPKDSEAQIDFNRRIDLFLSEINEDLANLKKLLIQLNPSLSEETNTATTSSTL